MEPIILKRLGIAVACSALTLLGTSRLSGGETLTATLASGATNEISALTSDGLQARRPFALPDGSVAFVSEGDLFRQSADATPAEQLTFTRGRLQSAAVLPDGRILYHYRRSQIGRLFTMLPDGTWSTLWPGLDDISVREFAVIDKGRLLVLDASEDLWLVSIADPYAPKERISVDLGGSSQGLYRAASLRIEPEPRLSEVGEFEDRTVLAVDAARPALRADTLPSIVKPEMETGYLFVIDVARTDDPELGPLDREEIAELRILRLEESGSETVLILVEPAGDGSVYVEVPADTPLALEMLDRHGVLLARTRTPIWIRPNERRGCIGCHVSPAYAPPNIRPEALLQEPHRIGSGTEVTP